MTARLACVLLLCPSHAFPATVPQRGLQGYSRRIWQTQDGLPEEPVRAIAQTPDGYLWIGASGGLVRFDGAEMVVYNRENTPALRENSIFCLRVSTSGDLWIGTEGGGVARSPRETAVMPADAAFAHAAVWKIHVPQIDNAVISLDYVGDIARVYAGGRLVTDDFYHGAPLEIGLWRTGPDLELQVLPLRGDAPIYLPPGARIATGAEVGELKSVKVIPEYEVTLRIP